MNIENKSEIRAEEITKSVILAYTRAGYNKDENTISLIVSDCMRWLQNFGKGMDEAECIEAIRRGTFKDFGDYTGLSSVVIVSWLKSWKMHPERFSKKRRIDVSHQLSESGTVTIEEQAKIDKEWISECCDKFNTLGWYSDMGHVLFLALKRQGLILTGKQRFDELFELVKSDEIAAAKLSNAKAEIGKTQMQRLIELITTGEVDSAKIKVRHKAVQLWLCENAKSFDRALPKTAKRS